MLYGFLLLFKHILVFDRSISGNDIASLQLAIHKHVAMCILKVYAWLQHACLIAA